MIQHSSPAILPILYEKNSPTTVFPFFPPWTFIFYAGYQGRVKIRVKVIVNYRIFLAAPVSLHEHGSALVLKEGCRVGSEIGTISITFRFATGTKK
jgi:hypothetical protein